MATDEHSDERRKKRREYFNRYRTEKKRQMNILVDPEHYKLLQKQARAHKLSLSRFVVGASLAYLNQTYIVPDPGQVRELSLAFRRIGNNLNQLARQGWKEGIAADDLTTAIEYVKLLEAHVTAAMTDPRDLLTIVREELQTNPDFKDQLASLLREVS